jgi:hypothetical protein
MSHGHYCDDLRPNAVVQRKWKTTKQDSACSMFGRGVFKRRLMNSIHRNGKLTKEGGSRQETSIFVPGLRVLYLSRGGRVKLNAHSVD